MGCLSLCCRGIGLVEVKFGTVLYLFVYLLTSSYYILGVDVKGVAHSAGFIEGMIPCRHFSDSLCYTGSQCLKNLVL